MDSQPHSPSLQCRLNKDDQTFHWSVLHKPTIFFANQSRIQMKGPQRWSDCSILQERDRSNHSLKNQMFCIVSTNHNRTSPWPHNRLPNFCFRSFVLSFYHPLHFLVSGGSTSFLTYTIMIITTHWLKHSVAVSTKAINAISIIHLLCAIVKELSTSHCGFNC